MSNGLGSPFCRQQSALPAAERQSCETSGFVASPVPTGNYGIDVHIDTGLFGISTGELLSVVQNLFVTPLWMALVWAVHALVVMLEWAFSLDLLAGSTFAALGARLQQMQAALTEPWLPLALAVASAFALYRGLVLRRVAEALAESALMCLMMVAGLWVVADPGATVGALARWANRASLGTLATAARGSPGETSGALASSMVAVFEAAVQGPWCYLEFGDVAWCRDPRRLDPRLHDAALHIADGEQALVGCRPGALGYETCAAPASSAAIAFERSARLLRGARTNGAVFLALPAGGPGRNSISEAGSLLRALCRSSDPKRCTGPAAAQAEFRTDGGTWPRVGGLLLILAGGLGMLLLLGFIAVRLLTAALFSLLYLLLAPAMVLAPAFGESGRTLFRRWAASLGAAVVSKLVFAFLLGVVLAVVAMLASLPLGWWTQWLLMSAFWWSAFTRRHRALGFAGAATATRAPRIRPWSIARTGGTLLRQPRRALSASSRRMGAWDPPDPPEQPWAGKGLPPPRAGGGPHSALGQMDSQASRAAFHERRDALAVLRDASSIEARISRREEQLWRLERAQLGAEMTGHPRRELEVRQRAERVREEMAADVDRLAYARRATGGREAANDDPSPTRIRELSDHFDEQAVLPGAREGRRVHGARRDYTTLAPLADRGRLEYAAMSSAQQRAVRLSVDRALAEREARLEGDPPAAVPFAAAASEQTSETEAHGHDETTGGGK